MNAADTSRERGQIPPGVHAAKFLAYKVGRTKTGTEQIGCLFELAEGGRQIVWYGSFTPDAFPVTVRALKALGWQGARIGTLGADIEAAKGKLVSLVIEHEQYEGRARARVRFINAPNEIRFAAKLSSDEQAQLIKKIDDWIASGLAGEDVEPQLGEESGRRRAARRFRR